MKLHITLGCAFYFSNMVSSLPTPGYPKLENFDSSRKTEDARFFDRWHSNFGNRLYKPSSSANTPPTLPTLNTNIFCPVPETSPTSAISLSSPPGFNPKSLYSIPLDPIQAPVYPTVMHGALNFLPPQPAFTPPAQTPPPAAPMAKPHVAWADWPELLNGELKLDAPPRVFRMPAFFRSADPKVPKVEEKQALEMPPNTMTKADLLEGIIKEVETECPDCGENVFGKKDWKTRITGWLRAVWRRFWGLVKPLGVVDQKSGEYWWR